MKSTPAGFDCLKWIVLLEIIGLAFSSRPAMSVPHPPAGRFIGVLRYVRGAADKVFDDHVEPRRDHLAKLDLIPTVRTNGNYEYTGILTLHGGTFYSPEYPAFHYTRVIWNPNNGQLIFNQNGQDLTIATTIWTEGNLIAKVMVPMHPNPDLNGLADEIEATLILGKEGSPFFPEYPLIPELAGEYRGTCGALEPTISIATWRSGALGLAGADPFSQYDTAALLGFPQPHAWGREWGFRKTETGLVTSCEDFVLKGKGRPCVFDNYNLGYNYMTGEIRAGGTKKHLLHCFVNSKGLYCDMNEGQPPCQLNRVIAPEDLEREKRGQSRQPVALRHMPTKESMQKELGSVKRTLPLTSVSHFGPLTVGWKDDDKEEAKTPDSSEVDGTYQGYLHHEYLDEYQFISASLMTIDVPAEEKGKNEKRLVASATLSLDGTPSVSLNYKFSNLPLLKVPFVLNGADRFRDAVLHVVELKNGIMKGVWFSYYFGRVGVFQLVKTKKRKKLAKPAKVIETPIGEYRSGLVKLTVSAFRGFPSNEADVFGTMQFQFTGQLLVHHTPIFGQGLGSYDMFTGNINIGGTFLGYRARRNLLRLRYITAVVGIGGIPLREFQSLVRQEKTESPLTQGTIIFRLPPKRRR